MFLTLVTVDLIQFQKNFDKNMTFYFSFLLFTMGIISITLNTPIFS